MKTILLVLLLAPPAYATSFDPILTDAATEALNPRVQKDLVELVHAASEKMLGHPYVGGNLGEGSIGAYDQDPLYRLDVFDCTTFVETIVTNVYCNDERRDPTAMSACLESQMQKVRYMGNAVSFTERNHFPEVDWIPNNIARGFFRDVTADIGGALTRHSVVDIDKKSWYSTRTINDIQTSDDEATKKTRLASLQHEGDAIAVQRASIPYLGFDLLFVKKTSADGHVSYEPNDAVLRAIPDGSMFNLVRENWNPASEGTGLAVSHQGFILQKTDGPYFRHASTVGQVMDSKLSDYMVKYVDHPTIRGINVLQILPKR